MASHFGAYFKDPFKHLATQAKSSAPAAGSKSKAAKKNKKAHDPQAKDKGKKRPEPQKVAISQAHTKSKKEKAAPPPGKSEVKRKEKEARKRGEEVKVRIESGMKGSKFRWLNEQLYTLPSRESHKLLKESKGLFQDYHTGYSEMMAKWPKNPLDLIIKELRKPKYEKAKIADLGCGTGRLSKELPERKVLSFDFVALDPSITECDIAHVPLKDSEADAAVFCLSLMGTNYLEFLFDANRYLKDG